LKRILFVVSRKQPDLVRRLEQQCRGGDVEIIVDRRVGERRQRSVAPPFADRRRGDRRIEKTSDLELIGIAVVVLP
jgi:hypothetical protein